MTMLLVVTITAEGGIHLDSADKARTGLAFEILRPDLHRVVPVLAEASDDKRLSVAAACIESANLRAIAAAGFTEIAVVMSIASASEVIATRHASTATEPYVSRRADGTPRCQAARDGECHWDQCPQLRDDDPSNTGRHCPLDLPGDDED